ncbi:type VI secretion system baseplate subunit TssG [Paraburkholderia tropica]|uniref:type VI secretion system baseplate subunit TssG n=1 Tax=Paraburkholderia tropica TaxID=92647 RepID=UPI0007ECE3E1|nr:type VI secretion system baseplate subunit TssG [Paraburkholderia tropica]OBR48534.1 type VI secretion protein [Paraburkholderia tropica]
MSAWAEDPRPLERLLAEPWRTEFFQAVRLLERWFVGHGGARPQDAVPYRIAFRTTLSTTFPPSEIEQIVSFGVSGDRLTDNPQRVAADVHRVDITPAFFGLLGSQGALPLRYTEQIAAQEQEHRDRSGRAFLDIFSNRATAHFYAAWKKYRLPYHYELDRNERYLPLLQSLAGIADPGTQKALQSLPGALVDDAIAGHGAAARHRAVSAIYLQRTLSDYFDVRFRVEQFVGHAYDVPRQQQSSLGQTNIVLGATALAGERVWLRNLRVRLVIGPLTAMQYDTFLPGSERARALARMLHLLVGMTLEYEVCLVLKREGVKPVQLGKAGCLGFNAFLSTRASGDDRRDMSYRLRRLNAPATA